jgi:hypothetical protein
LVIAWIPVTEPAKGQRIGEIRFSQHFSCNVMLLYNNASLIHTGKTTYCARIIYDRLRRILQQSR